jgi:hypothetical protein
VKPQRLFDKKLRMMVLLAAVFPQACVAGRRRPESSRTKRRAVEKDCQQFAGEAFISLDLFHRGRDSNSIAGEAFISLDLFHRGRNPVIRATSAHTRQCAHY